MKNDNDATRCPLPHELTRAFFAGPGDPLHSHLASCQRCAEMARLSHLIRQVPVQLPPAARRKEVRTGLLAIAAARKPARRTWRRTALAATLLLFGAAAALFGRSALAPEPYTPPAPEPRGVLYPQAGARFSHQVSPEGDVVRLTEGTLLVEVEHLGPKERFLVVVGDAEIEVRGASPESSADGEQANSEKVKMYGVRFEVIAGWDHLQSVRVFQGEVEVRPVQMPEQRLGANKEWRAPVEAEPDTASTAHPTPETTPAAPVAVTAPPVRSAPPAVPRKEQAPALDPREVAFQEGTDALRSGDFDLAAERFEHAAKKAALAEDASLWRAIALARAGHTAEASLALSAFLSRYPTSPRAGEAHATLGWLLFKQDQLDAAEKHFLAALSAPAEIRKSARAGLDAIAARRKEAAP